jgi:CubicO group peptidase (beta-lactamase class C family)
VRHVADLIDALVERGTVPGAQLAVVDAGGATFRHWAGHADREKTVPVDGGTRFALASLTKPLVAAAALVAAEEGSLNLDEPVARHVPRAPQAITMRMLLAHYSGLPEGAPVEPLPWPELREAYAAVPPERPPGERRVYSNPAYALAGAAIEHATGIPIDTYLAEAVLTPLGMTSTSLGLEPGAPAAWVRDAGLFAPGVQLFNSDWFRATPMPQSAGWSTADDYARFLACVLREGAPILAPETAAELLTNQGGALPGGVESFMTWPVADWAIGLELRSTKERHWTGAALSPRAGTHFGASGTLCFADPVHGIAAALLCNRGTYSGWMLTAGAWPDIVSAILSSW